MKNVFQPFMLLIFDTEVSVLFSRFYETPWQFLHSLLHKAW